MDKRKTGPLIVPKPPREDDTPPASVTLVSLHREFKAHAQLDATELAGIKADVAGLKDTIKSTTRSQTVALSVVITLASALGAFLHHLITG